MGWWLLVDVLFPLFWLPDPKGISFSYLIFFRVMRVWFVFFFVESRILLITTTTIAIRSLTEGKARYTSHDVADKNV